MNQVLQLQSNRHTVSDPMMVAKQCSQTQQAWHIHHTLYDCTIYIWLAEGSVKINKVVSPRFFLYIEYRDVTRSCRYRSLDFPERESAIQFVDTQADSLPLPAISPAMTRRYPIGVL